MFTIVPYRRYIRGSRNMPSLFDESVFQSLMNFRDAFAAPSFRVDIHRDENAYLLEAELPGFPQDKINLSVDGDMLTISAESESNTKEEKDNRCYSERWYGQVERSFNMEGIHASAITAESKDGILNVHLPKKQPVQENGVRRIPINAQPAIEGETATTAQ